MKSIPTGLVLLRTRRPVHLKIITSDTQKILIHLSVRSDFRPPLTRGLLCHKGRDTRLISRQILLFMRLPLLMKHKASCPPLTLKMSWGEPSFFLLKRMGIENELTLSNMSPILKFPKLLMKISFTYASKFKTRMILKSLYLVINSWTSWNKVQSLKS